jgi:toxin ParE1/3/4
VIRLRIAPRALNDLASIWTYTDETWGQQRADDYIAAIHHSIGRLCTFPELGSLHSSKVGTFRKLSSGRHLIFYQFVDPIVTVVRILHARIDVEVWLGE